MQIKSHDADISIESVIANFTGFGSAATDQQISYYLSVGTPGWIADHQELVNAEVRKVVVGYVNELIQKLSNFNGFASALINYNPSQGENRR